jgi:hypothetical protein
MFLYDTLLDIFYNTRYFGISVAYIAIEMGRKGKEFDHKTCYGYRPNF